jgi:hypothetical protein
MKGGRGGRLMLGLFDCCFEASSSIITSSYANVWFWPKADIAMTRENVRFRG